MLPDRHKSHSCSILLLFLLLFYVKLAPTRIASGSKLFDGPNHSIWNGGRGLGQLLFSEVG